LKTQIGFCSTKAELSEDLMTLTQTGMFESVEAEIYPVEQKHHDNAVKVIFKFTSRDFPPMESFRVAGASKIPHELIETVMTEYKKRGQRAVDISTIAMIKNIVEGFYEEHGFAHCYITHFDGMEGGHVVANVAEGRVRSVKLVPLDDTGNPTEKREHNLQMITLDVRNQIKEGELFSIKDTRKALREVFATQMFENVQVLQKPYGDSISSPVIDVEVLVRERPAKSVEIEMDWQVQPGGNGSFLAVNPLPGGTMIFMNRNIKGNGTQVFASVSTQNLILPADDTLVKLDIKKTFLWGINNSKRSSLNITAFNTRKPSTIFSSTASVKIKPLWITRFGIKASLSEKYSRNSLGSVSLIAESVTCHDDSGLVVAKVQKDGFGEPSDGLPTTLCDSGSDKLLLFRGDVIRDTSYRKDESVIGQKQILSFDQGLGISSKTPVFHRHMASTTHLLPLWHLPVKKSAPAVLIFHGKFQNCIGDVPPYDYPMLGGPSSCRGYNMGEIGSARNLVETAIELRYPLPVTDGQIYSFAEHSDSFDSGKYLRGNPNSFFRLNGKGTSWGYGIRVGVTRLEYARDCNLGSGNWFVRFGERF